MNKYPQLPIRTITLYRYHSEDARSSIIYALVIEVAETVKAKQELMQTFSDLQRTTGLLLAVPHSNTAREFGIDASFYEIYREKPSGHPLREWTIFLKTTDESMPKNIMAKEKGLVLYESAKKSQTPLITEIEGNEAAISVLLAIRELQDDNQEDSETLGQPIRIPVSDISERSCTSLPLARCWISKLMQAGLLLEGFGELYGVSQPGLEFLLERGLIK